MSAGPSRRHLLWQVVETAGFEAAWLSLDGLRLHAMGTAVGQLPRPYWLRYELATDANAITERLEVVATTDTAEHRLDLLRHNGIWTVNGQARPDLADALDCDLACSPVTNTMPILRHGLARAPGSQRFVMAFVQVPSLRVVPAAQSYAHLDSTAVDGAGHGARVRYASGSFSADLTVDADGVVIDYPTMARRVEADISVTSAQRA
ncbi:MAG: putative glycolipid-binding domain-containing protein, partial [Sciscionella sp.]|nr:putative glycolipid-binding domain-containing protein [Sciscionella sp.]